MGHRFLFSVIIMLLMKIPASRFTEWKLQQCKWWKYRYLNQELFLSLSTPPLGFEWLWIFIISLKSQLKLSLILQGINFTGDKMCHFYYRLNIDCGCFALWLKLFKCRYRYDWNPELLGVPSSPFLYWFHKVSLQIANLAIHHIQLSIGLQKMAI